MSRLYLYAISDRSQAGATRDALPGVDDLPVDAVTYRDITAWVSPVGAGSLPASEERLWQHERAIERLMAGQATLPARYGTVLAGETAVLDQLAARYDDFVRNLAGVRGCVELSLHVLWQDTDPPAPTETPAQPQSADEPSPLSASRFLGEPGECHPEPASCASEGSRPTQTGRQSASSEYLRRRLDAYRLEQERREQGEQITREIEATLAGCAEASSTQVLPTPKMLLTAAYLVKRELTATFAGRLQALESRFPELRFLCTGPWPPYSFVGPHKSATRTIGERRCL